MWGVSLCVCMESLCRERLDYMHVCVCVWRTGDVSECRERSGRPGPK